MKVGEEGNSITMLRRLSCSASLRAATVVATTACSVGSPFRMGIRFEQKRDIYADKLRAGHILRIDKKYYRVISNGRSQKGQSTASFHCKMVEIGNNERTKEVISNQTQDFVEARFERLRLLFSGFDDDDNACFVYPQHSNEAGREVNIPASKLPEVQQKFLAVMMPCDVLHIFAESDDEADYYGEVMMPTNWAYSVEKVRMKGMYKMAVFNECDGEITVGDQVGPGDKVKVIIRPDGSASFSGKE